MRWKSVIPLPSFSRLDRVAMGLAALLSIACLARGAVYDGLIAVLLLLSLPLLFLALTSSRAVHAELKIIGAALFGGFAVLLLLQQLLPSSGGSGWVWQHAQQLLGQDMRSAALYDKAAWFQGLGRYLLFLVTFVIALFIGSYESSTRLFLQVVLITGILCLMMTFFITTEDGVPSSSYYSYTHGFVNPNNAASYLGIMFLLTLAQSARFFRYPIQSMRKNLPELLDQLSIAAMIQGICLLFSILLVLAGLLMTASRGGIFLSLFCGLLFAAILGCKLHPTSRTRKTFVAVVSATLLLLLGWSFINFGQIIASKVDSEGINHHTRVEIFAATWPMIAEHPWRGVGLGSFPAAFQHYRPDSVSSDGIIDKAHNSYLEFAAEMGIPALLVVMLALSRLGYVLVDGVRHRKERYIVPALGVSVGALMALCSLIDFPLQVPGIAALVIAVITVCVSQTDPRLCEPTHTHRVPVRRIRTRKRRNRMDGHP